jgi:hypothetical protein
MPRTDVLNRILTRAAHELGPIVEKAQLSRGSFTLGEMEAGVLVAVRNIAVFALSELCGLGQKERKKRVRGHPDVGEGKHWLPFIGFRWRRVLTLFGWIRFRRAYYHNADLKDSRWPREEELGLAPDQIWSPGLQDNADYGATVTGSYRESAKTLKKFLGVDVQYKQIQRDCLEVGADLAATQKQQVKMALEVKKTPDSPPQKEGPAPACVMILADGTIVDEHSSSSRGSGLEVKVGRVDVACLQENKPASKATQKTTEPPTPADNERQKELAKLKESREQRQYKAATKLVKQALETAAPDRHDQPIYRPSNPTSRYCATAEKGIEIIGGLLWALAAAAGVERAALVLFLADGSHWCWNLCDTNFPQAVKILDLFHLAGKVLKAAGVLFGESSTQAKDWAREKLVEILRGHLDRVRAELASLSFTDERKRKASHELQTYLKNNMERMDYPRYLAAGYPISSAAMEGACGHVIGDRMTGSGRGWDEIGADAMARLRALHCSEQWDRFYQDRQARLVTDIRSLRRAA